MIEKAVSDAVNNSDVQLVLVSGGTGFTPDDMTPEVISSMLTRRADSIVQYLQQEALKITPMACLSRTVIGTIGESSVMVVTLPGKPKAIHENLSILFENGVLAHALS
jgi:molybdenum cofactor synthesis domain-containing protein